jgi:hypothetical protein
MAAHTEYCNPYDYERAHGHLPGEAPEAPKHAAPEDDGARPVIGFDPATGNSTVETKVVVPPSNAKK